MNKNLLFRHLVNLSLEQYAQKDDLLGDILKSGNWFVIVWVMMGF